VPFELSTFRDFVIKNPSAVGTAGSRENALNFHGIAQILASGRRGLQNDGRALLRISFRSGEGRDHELASSVAKIRFFRLLCSVGFRRAECECARAVGAVDVR
jgi:hypothetical protein